MTTCGFGAEPLEHFASKELPDDQQEAIRSHVATCKTCRDSLENIHSRRQALRLALEEDAFDTASLESKILGAIQTEAVPGRGRPRHLALAAAVVLALGAFFLARLIFQPPGPVISAQILVRAPIGDVWRTITTSEDSSKFFFDLQAESGWQIGDPLIYRTPDGQPYMAGKIEQVEPPHRLRYTVRFLRDAETEADPPSVVTWALEPAGEDTRIRLRHDAFPGETATYHLAAAGWPEALRRLAAYLESDVSSEKPE